MKNRGSKKVWDNERAGPKRKNEKQAGQKRGSGRTEEKKRMARLL